MKKNTAALTALLAALALLAAGLFSGQYDAVMQKAVRICLECVGIG